MIEQTNERIEKILLLGHAHGVSERDIINQLKSVGVTKTDMDNYRTYVKELDHEINSNN